MAHPPAPKASGGSSGSGNFPLSPAQTAAVFAGILVLMVAIPIMSDHITLLQIVGVLFFWAIFIGIPFIVWRFLWRVKPVTEKPLIKNLARGANLSAAIPALWCLLYVTWQVDVLHFSLTGDSLFTGRSILGSLITAAFILWAMTEVSYLLENWASSKTKIEWLVEHEHHEEHAHPPAAHAPDAPPGDAHAHTPPH